MRKNGVRMLLMGGQACVFYGAAEFSRDLDILVLTDSENLERLRDSLELLTATGIAIPPLAAKHLNRGHAVHFRCGADGVAGLRIDIMSSLRGVDLFSELWNRRTTIEADGELIDLLSLEDLVAAKKTQRHKDWPMIRRLVERDYFTNESESAVSRITFWMRELRTTELLMKIVAVHPGLAATIAKSRYAVEAARSGDPSAVTRALDEEERAEREKDRVYWEPLKRELEGFRRAKRSLQEIEAAD